jgi:murein DD-endopeptidase MepM/ murein hydrolase activator NlpD
MYPSVDNLICPIDGNELPGFHEWINWNWYELPHTGFDFAAYLTESGNAVLGLPETVRVRAVARGEVIRVMKDLRYLGGYQNSVVLAHENNLNTLYGHIMPSVEVGDILNQGDAVGTLFKDPGDDLGRLVHLHFETHDARSERYPSFDPERIFSAWRRFAVADPYDSANFTLHGRRPNIEITGFRDLVRLTLDEEHFEVEWDDRRGKLFHRKV